MGDKKPKKNSSGTGDKYKAQQAGNAANRAASVPKADLGKKDKKK
jgi:hypothetical protein